MERKTRYREVNKSGKELYSSNGFLGFVGSTILVQLGAALVLMIIAGVVCGIASLFS